MRERNQDEPIGESTLLPPLSDELVLTQIWPLLHQRVDVSLLWRLRRVNRSWKREVGTTLEWAALEMVRIDAPGLTRFLERCGERRPSLRDRVESELSSFAVLLAERLSDFSPQAELTQLNVIGAESVERGEKLGKVGITSGSVTGEAARRSSCVCNRVEFSAFEESQNRDRSEYTWDEEEEFEAYSSSSGSSMRAYYPRHSMRIN